MCSITETGIIAISGMIFGFIIACCRQIEQSRCKDISICWGLINCNRDVIHEDKFLEMAKEEEKKENV
jgi:hypothetical protein